MKHISGAATSCSVIFIPHDKSDAVNKNLQLKKIRSLYISEDFKRKKDGYIQKGGKNTQTKISTVNETKSPTTA